MNDEDLLRGLPTGTEVLARYNFIAEKKEFLSFQKGDRMTITQKIVILFLNIKIFVN